ncbi:uncharacterized protein LOC134211705 isoform X2 [Armigeres subalbatus]|uniref:uncharacterized protein LOC134211705 isoform X2 n=1 Tax=Armigeres subalbatus TaxID=124917 RepID=UPI002ED2F395
METNIFRLRFLTTIVAVVHYGSIAGDPGSEWHNVNNGYTYLRDLPLSQLLKLQKSVCDISQNIISSNNISLSAFEKRKGLVEDAENEQHKIITALPLTNEFSGRSAVEAWDSRPSKIQSIFQISVTALSFLAFASYLLCMIVQAIKSKVITIISRDHLLPSNNNI